MRNCFCAPDAIAYIKGGSDAQDLYGQVKFYGKRDFVLIVAEIYGLPNNDTGFFGFHIHEGKSCSGENFADTKSHYNPKATPHPEHSGDLPPLMSFDNKAYLAVKTNRFSINEIIGRTVVIHRHIDDFTGQPAGNAGEKIACGVIKKA